jgi:cytochrome c-type biogenesis protein CcmH/NrfG
VGDRQRAAELLEQVRSANPEILLALAYLAFYRESQGNHTEAERLVAEMLAVNADLSAEMTLHWLGPLEDPALIVATLRRAGLP